MPQYTPAPGWYADPSGQTAWRWWDGRAWTAYTSAPTWAGGAVTLASSVDAEARSARRARVAVLTNQLGAGASAVVVCAQASAWRNAFHAMRVSFDGRLNTGPGRLYVVRVPDRIGYLMSVVAIVTEILYFIWQYRSAGVARRLGYPATRSPAWGVGCFFVPIVNLWMPYQAVRDLAPPGHRTRRLVLPVWLFVLASALLAISLVFASELAAPVRDALLAIDLVCDASVAWLAWHLVTAVVEVHRVQLSALSTDA